MTSIFVFILGLILGSFLSVVWARLEVADSPKPKRRLKKKKPTDSIVSGRSRCDHCGKQLDWHDNIPLVSFLVLRGKCRHCGKSISHYHPVLELSSGLYLVAAYLAYGFSPQLAVSALFGLPLLLILAYDLKHQLIPNVITVPAIALALILILAENLLEFFGSSAILGLWAANPDSYVIGGAAVGGFFLLMSLASGGKWIGGGDIKLGFLIGLLLGWPYALVALILAYLIGCIYALALLLSRKASLQSSISFGPMLVMGFFIAQFYGGAIIEWYNGWFL